MQTTIIYKIYCPTLSCELVFPSLNDIKLLLHNEEELFDLLLLNKIQIIPETVSVDSERYRTPMHNRQSKVRQTIGNED